MSDKAKALAAALIRNFSTAPKERFQREPLITRRSSNYWRHPAR